MCTSTAEEVISPSETSVAAVRLRVAGEGRGRARRADDRALLEAVQHAVSLCEREDREADGVQPEQREQRAMAPLPDAVGQGAALRQRVAEPDGPGNTRSGSVGGHAATKSARMPISLSFLARI